MGRAVTEIVHLEDLDSRGEDEGMTAYLTRLGEDTNCIECRMIVEQLTQEPKYSRGLRGE